MLDRSVAPRHTSSFNISLQKAQTHHLDNDILLHTLEAGTQPVVKVEVLFPTGGAYYEDKKGISLMALKLLQEGTLSFTSSQLSSHFAQYGAFVNVSPSFDVASISLYCLSKHLEILLPQFTEIVLSPVFPAAEVQRVRQIEIQQLRMQNERSNVIASKKFRQLIFGEANPYGKIINEQDLDEITPEDLQHFHEKQLNNFEIIASGQADNQTVQLLTSFFGKKSNARSVRSPQLYAVKTGASDIKENRPAALQSSVRMGKLVVDKTHEDFIPLLITSHVLGGYFGSRLMKNIREDKGYTYGVYSSLVSLKHNTYFVVGTDVIKEFSEQTVAEVKMELEKLCTTPVGSQELNAVKNHMLGHFQSQLTSAFSLAEKFKNIHVHGLNYSYYQKFLETLQSIDSSTIQQMANKYLEPSSLRTVVVG